MNNQVDNHGHSTETPSNDEPKKGWRKVLEVAVNWLSYKNKHKWLEEMRGNMSVVAVFIATVTFQMALNPPGGVRSVKEDADPPHDILSCDVQGRKKSNLCPGEAVLAIVYPDSYSAFLFWNTICFSASLVVLLLLMSGIPLSHRFSTWLLSIGMFFTLITLGVTYRIAVAMVTPNIVLRDTLFLLLNLLRLLVAVFSLLGFFTHTAYYYLGNL